MTETTAAPDFLCARLNAARTSPESFDLDVLLGETVAALGRWDALKAHLRDRIDAETPVMEGFRGEITGAASGGMVSACRSALAEMKRLENER